MSAVSVSAAAAYQIQPLIPAVLQEDGLPADSGVSLIRCAQALGSEIYIGHANGELLRYALQADDPNKPEAYTLISRQSLPHNKPIDEIVIIPSICRVLLLSEKQLHFYTLPSLDPVNATKPIRNVIAFAVDNQHLKRPSPTLNAQDIMQSEVVEFCVMKRTTIQMYSLRERLQYLREIPFPSGGICAKRTGGSLCIADAQFYNIVDLEKASMLPVMPISQAQDPSDFDVKPHILVTGDNEFLILSSTDAGTLGVFVRGDGDPCRGTLEWPAHPVAICFDYPHITTLLPNKSIEIHDIETQALVQVITDSDSSPSSPHPGGGTPQPALSRSSLSACISGCSVPSSRSDNLGRTPVKLLRATSASQVGQQVVAAES